MNWGEGAKWFDVAAGAAVGCGNAARGTSRKTTKTGKEDETDGRGKKSVDVGGNGGMKIGTN
jgi:hypothetical protein